jgi:triphosphatase
MPQDVALLARRLQKDLPVAFEPRTKAERGYALLKGEVASAVRATPISLGDDLSSGEAFSRIGMSCLHHLAANAQVVAAGQAEGVHEMRVGLRRLRAAISLFRDVTRDSELKAVKEGLRWLMEELAPARDVDVLVKEAVTPMREANPDKPEIAVLEKNLKGERTERFEHAREAVSSDRFRQVVLQTALWLLDGNWSRNKNGRSAKIQHQAVSRVAADILDRRARKIIKKAKKLKKLDDRRRHKLRIGVKKLRYGCDFFDSLFDHPKRRYRYEKVLTKLQDNLGKANDIRIHAESAHKLANRLRRMNGRSQAAYAMGFLTGGEQKLPDGLCLRLRTPAASYRRLGRFGEIGRPKVTPKASSIARWRIECSSTLAPFEFLSQRDKTVT